MSLLKKRVKDLTPEQLSELVRTVGTTSLPYPASHFIEEGADKLKLEIGLIADDQNPLAVYSTRPHEYVVGQLFRKMAIPSLLHVQKESILRRAPESKNRVMLILGQPGTGKSEGAKTIADICDERGADVVDCGGQYLGDLLWEQVIDYGEDFKTALTERIKSGLLSEASIRIFDEQFPDALVRDNDGKITGIDWDKTIHAKDKEDTASALDRAMALVKIIAEYESIPTQAVNSVGIKKIPGVIKRWHDEGRTGILDEYTKSLEGSDDSLQTVLQYLNGEIDECVVTNTMKVAGREETYSYTLKRENMKAGFFVYMTGNDQEDGISTHMLSKSAYSRLPVFKIEEMQAVDWKHRISQILTGLPLSTIYSVFSQDAKEDPQEFARTLIELRMMGLSAEEQADVPVQQLTFLQNFEKTIAAVEKLEQFYRFWARIIDPKSDLFDPAKDQNKDYINDIMPEISASYRDESAIDFRKIIKDLADALKARPEVKQVAGSGLRLNLSGVGRDQTVATPDPEVFSAEFGTRLEAVLKERVGIMTQGRPHLQAALIKEGTERGVFTSSTNANTETAATLLNQDMYTAVGGIKSVAALRDTLLFRLLLADEKLKGKSDDEIMTMDEAAAACEELSALQDNPQVVVLGKSAGDIFKKVSTVDAVTGVETPAAKDLVASTDLIESLKIPALAHINLAGTFQAGALSDDKRIPEDAAPIVDIAEAQGDSKLAVTTVLAQSAANQNETVPVHILVDGERKKTLIVTDEADAGTKAAVSEDFEVVSYDDADAEERVGFFIRSALMQPSRSDKIAELERQLTFAFMLRAGREDKVEPLEKMMTTRNLPVEAPIYMSRKQLQPA